MSRDSLQFAFLWMIFVALVIWFVTKDLNLVLILVGFGLGLLAGGLWLRWQGLPIYAGKQDTRIFWGLIYILAGGFLIFVVGPAFHNLLPPYYSLLVPTFCAGLGFVLFTIGFSLLAAKLAGLKLKSQ